MPPIHRDAGPWTIQKLTFLSEYLAAYVRATKPIRRADVCFMDLFAGPGFDKDRDTGEVVDGSPVLALKLHPGFRRFVFIDKDRACTTQLRDLAFDRRLDEMTHLLTGDCNSLISQALVNVPTDGATFAFVDPAGVHLDWATVRAIASHKPEPRRRIELFVLFPYDMALVRFLTLDKTPEEIWGPEIEHRLDATMPDAVRWRRVYQARRDGDIDPEETRRRFAYLYPIFPRWNSVHP